MVDVARGFQYLSPMGEWRRVSDWKREITVVSIADVPRATIEAHGWALPADRVVDRWPALASLAREVGVARVDRAVAKVLRADGIVTHELGYHRGSDGWTYQRSDGTAEPSDGDAGELVSELMGDREDDELYDRLHDDVVDAIFRVCSEERLDERSVIVAGELPTLGPAGAELDVDEEELDRLEAIGARGLPERASPEVLEAVRAWLTAPTVTTTTMPPSAETHANMRKALGWAAGLAALAFFFRERAPMVAAIASALAITALVIALLARIEPR